MMDAGESGSAWQLKGEGQTRVEKDQLSGKDLPQGLESCDEGSDP